MAIATSPQGRKISVCSPASAFTLGKAILDHVPFQLLAPSSGISKVTPKADELMIKSGGVFLDQASPVVPVCWCSRLLTQSRRTATYGNDLIVYKSDNHIMYVDNQGNKCLSRYYIVSVPFSASSSVCTDIRVQNISRGLRLSKIETQNWDVKFLAKYFAVPPLF